MSDPMSLAFFCKIHAAPAEVLRAFTHATLLRDWLCDAASTTPRPGGNIYLYWNDGGTVTGSYEKINAPHDLQLTWLSPALPGPTRVAVTCEPEGESTHFSLTHTSLDAAQDWTAAAEKMQAAWNAALENLASVLETGIDLRLARRPRLGIFMEELTPELIKKLNLPAEHGVLLEGTAEGSGAQAAGLQKGDLLVSLNGSPIQNTSSFAPLLKSLKAGDRPNVEYYRDGQKHSVPVQLGSFPMPDYPAIAEELADKVRRQNAQILADMRAQIGNLSEEQASIRPEENEWSVKELVAHFILAERDYQSWAADMFHDNVIEDWLEMRSNQQPRITALVERFHSLPALLDELAMAKEETGAMITAFPPDFIRRRPHFYRRLAGWALDTHREHYYDEHKDQFQVAIDTAKIKRG